ncbi:hypothetical protein [Amycolatopsis minnesotensis]|uniref:Uncharacterized protein n=1 Tax=Amycolatopsis minnesotensis TaxID=337894 RepID=A0ABP5BP29_9PSEU
MSEETDGTALAGQARDALAQRARWPWWYIGLMGLALLGLLAAPLVPHLTTWSGAYQAVMWPSLVILLFGDLLLSRLRGTAFSRKTLRAYPSTRLTGVALLVVGVAGIVAVNLLVRAEETGPGIAVAIATAVIGAGLMCGMNAAMRRDIRDGRVVRP